MRTTEDKILQQRTAEREDYLRFTTQTMRTLSIIFGVLTAILFLMLLREFGRRLYFQEELQHKVDELGRSKQELEHIAYATSHDLQEPLRKIRIMLDKWQSREAATGTGNAELAGRIQQASARMQGLVGDLMMLTSLNAEAPLVLCPLDEAIEGAAQQLRDSIEQSSARIDIGALPRIQGYPDQLVLLFRHLLDNALKFSRPGVAPEVSIRYRTAESHEIEKRSSFSEHRYYCISICDNGRGFDSQHAEKIFGIFRTLQKDNDGQPGKGAGLAICRRIMTNHQGDILADSTPGAGTCFRLYFPVPE